MGFDEKKGEDKKEATAVSETNKVADSDAETDNEGGGGRPMSESSFYTTEEEEDEDTANKIQLGPQVTLKEQFEKDKVFVVLPWLIAFLFWFFSAFP